MSAAVVPSSGSLVRNTTFGPLFPSIERRARATASQRPSTSATFNIRGHAAQAGHLTVLRALHGLVQVVLRVCVYLVPRLQSQDARRSNACENRESRRLRAGVEKA